MRNEIPVAPLGSVGGNKNIPLLGFGTAEYPFGATSTIKDSILHAIKLGYRHFDTASLYQTEKPLGEAISEALKFGYITSRDELFVTSKLWVSDAQRGHVLPALKKSLENLKLDYLDLYLIHFPISSEPGKIGFPIEQKPLPMDYKSVWEDMEECQELGLTKLIGVSNFSCKKLETLLDIAKVPPAVNQVEMNPLWQQKKLRTFCEEKGIHISAYSPLGGRDTLWGTNLVMNNEVLKEIANAKGRTIAQVCLRWACEQEVSVIMKSFNKGRIEENLEIFDWKLSTEDLDKICQLPQRKGFPGIEFIYDEGPFKSIEELWDGEI